MHQSERESWRDSFKIVEYIRDVSLDSRPLDCNHSWWLEALYITFIVAAECPGRIRDRQPHLAWLPVAPLHQEDGLHPRLEAEIFRVDRGQVVLLRHRAGGRRGPWGRGHTPGLLHWLRGGSSDGPQESYQCFYSACQRKRSIWTGEIWDQRPQMLPFPFLLDFTIKIWYLIIRVLLYDYRVDIISQPRL